MQKIKVYNSQKKKIKKWVVKHEERGEKKL